MNYTTKIQRAIKFAIKTHEIYQKQIRKGKGIAYITHPLTAGIILANAGTSEDVIVAGILHDTIEDSVESKKVTEELISKIFGKNVAQLVMSVTEKNKELSWDERKREALEHIKDFSNDSLLIKSADVISNVTELLDDYKKEGDLVFLRFNAPREKVIRQQLKVIDAILKGWKENPLAKNLFLLRNGLLLIKDAKNSTKNPPKVIKHEEYDENIKLRCPLCGWEGTPKNGGYLKHYDVSLNISCSNCEEILLIVCYSKDKE